MAIGLTINGVDRTSLLRDGSINLSLRLFARGSGSISINSSDGYRPSVGHGVTIYDTGAPVFSGSIDQITETSMVDSATSPDVFLDCLLVSPESRLDARIITVKVYTSTNAGSIVSDLLANWANGEFISAGTIQDGADIDKLVVNHRRVSDVIDDLANLSGFVWWVDENYHLNFQARNTTSAPFSLSNASANFTRISLRKTREDYVNEKWLGIDWAAFGRTVETFHGDGSTRTWNLAHLPELVESITLNGADVSFGVRDVDTGRQYYYADGELAITQDTGETLLTSGDDLVVTYRELGTNYIYAGNSTEISARATIEGNSGKYGAVEVSSSNQAVQSLAALEAEIADSSVIPQELSVETMNTAPRPGMLVPVSLTTPTISGQFLISEVTVRDEPGWGLIYTYTALDGSRLGGWIEFFAKLADKGAGSSPIVGHTTSGGGGSTPEPPDQPTSVTVTLLEYGADPVTGTPMQHLQIGHALPSGSDADYGSVYLIRAGGNAEPLVGTVPGGTVDVWVVRPHDDTNCQAAVVLWKSTYFIPYYSGATKSSVFVLPGIGAPNATKITDADIGTARSGTDGAGVTYWGAPFTWTEPSDDPEWWVTEMSVQVVNSSGTPRPDEYGVERHEVFESAGIPGQHVVCNNVNGWPIPDASDPYRIHRFRLYGVSRAGLKSLYTTAWPGSSDHLDFDPTTIATGGLDLGKAKSSSIGRMLVKDPVTGQLRVATDDSSNPVPNPDFEFGLDGLTTSGTVEIVSSPVRTGTKAAKITGAYSLVQWVIAAKPGQSWYAEEYLTADSGTDGLGRIYLQALDATETWVGDPAYGEAASVPSPGNWVKVSQSITIPSGASYLAIWAWVLGNTTGAWYCDGVSIRKVATGDEIENAAVTQLKIADAAVTEAKIAASAITNAKVADLAISTTKIVDAAVGNNKIAPFSVDATKIQNAAIQNAHLDQASIYRVLIQDASIVSLAANKITAGTFAAGVVYAGSVAVSQLTAGTATFTGPVTFQNSSGPSISIDSTKIDITSAGLITRISSGQVTTYGVATDILRIGAEFRVYAGLAYTTATAGSYTPPALVAGYVKARIDYGGFMVDVKIPYYLN